MRQFTSVADVPDMHQLMDKAMFYKQHPLAGRQLGQGKRIGLLFLNPSLRTRLSTQIAARNLGMEAIVFNIDKEGWAMEFEEGAVMDGTAVEHIMDAAPVLGQYFDLIAIRTFPSLKDREQDDAERVLNQLIRYSGIPVLSLESATLHPLQSLADILSIREDMEERATRKPKVVLSWAPHIKALPQCVANSFAQWVNAWGTADFVIAQPEGYELPAVFTEGATIVYSQEEAFRDADYVYVKNWSSYEHYGQMPEVAGNWFPDLRKHALTRNAGIMHCLPVRRNVELADELLDHPRSLVTRQAANRVWAAQAVLSNLLIAKV